MIKGENERMMRTGRTGRTGRKRGERSGRAPAGGHQREDREDREEERGAEREGSEGSGAGGHQRHLDLHQRFGQLVRLQPRAAGGEAVSLLHPALPSAGVAIGMERESVADVADVADALSPSLWKHLRQVEGGAAEWQSRRRRLAPDVQLGHELEDAGALHPGVGPADLKGRAGSSCFE